mmetsp:Transcript_1834/g.2831  ORF Transcript_1834/g.2831 Transcript_1834/m.2831 type:complete len:638 (+) Transcript_1834:228-2141(+)
MADNSNINAQQQQENDEAEEIENSRRIATTTRKLPSRNLKQSMPDFAKSSFARSLYNMDDSVLNSHPVFDNIDRGDIGDITNDELLFNPPPPPPPPSVNQEEQEKKMPSATKDLSNLYVQQPTATTTISSPERPSFASLMKDLKPLHLDREESWVKDLRAQTSSLSLEGCCIAQDLIQENQQQQQQQEHSNDCDVSYSSILQDSMRSLTLDNYQAQQQQQLRRDSDNTSFGGIDSYLRGGSSRSFDIVTSDANTVSSSSLFSTSTPAQTDRKIPTTTLNTNVSVTTNTFPTAATTTPTRTTTRDSFATVAATTDEEGVDEATAPTTESIADIVRKQYQKVTPKEPSSSLSASILEKFKQPIKMNSSFSSSSSRKEIFSHRYYLQQQKRKEEEQQQTSSEEASLMISSDLCIGRLLHPSSSSSSNRDENEIHNNDDANKKKDAQPFSKVSSINIDNNGLKMGDKIQRKLNEDHNFCHQQQRSKGDENDKQLKENIQSRRRSSHESLIEQDEKIKNKLREDAEMQRNQKSRGESSRIHRVSTSSSTTATTSSSSLQSTKKSNEGEENKQGKGPIQKYEHVVTCLKCKSELCAKRTAFLVSCPKCHSVSPNCGSNRTTTSVATAASATMNRVSSGSGLRA